MIKFQQSQALTSHFESFWSIVHCGDLKLVKIEMLLYDIGQNNKYGNSGSQNFTGIKAKVYQHWAKIKIR